LRCLAAFEDWEDIAVTLGGGQPERPRPIGVSVLAILAAIGCALGMVVTLVAIGGGDVTGVGALALVVVLLVVVLSGVTAFGLWELRWWAWPLALLSWSSAGMGALIGLAGGAFSTDVLVAPIAIAYLLLHDTRSAFGPRVGLPSRPFVAVTATLALVFTLLPAVSAAAASWSPSVPNDAGTTLVAQIDVARLGSPEAGGTGPEAASLVGADCLDRDQRPAGWLDLCWSVTRLPDEDPDGDYYRFEAGGTFGWDATEPGQAAGSGVRWVVLRNRLLTPVADGVSSAQPDGTTTGCPAAGDEWMLGATGPSLPCDGKTVGSADLQTHTVTWTCVACLLLTSSTERAIGLSEDIKVAEGVAPAWMLYADFGT
jgi:hypothetical protein